MEGDVQLNVVFRNPLMKLSSSFLRLRRNLRRRRRLSVFIVMTLSLLVTRLRRHHLDADGVDAHRMGGARRCFGHFLPAHFGVGAILSLLQFHGIWGSAAARRIPAAPVRKHTLGASLCYGLGLCVLALTRPYEGALLSALLTGWLLLESRSTGVWSMIREGLPPAGGLLLVTGIFIGYYNWRVTGSPARLPYAAYQQEYGHAPVFWFQKAQSDESIAKHPWLGNFDEWEYSYYFQQTSLRGLLEITRQKLARIWEFYRSYALLGLIGLPLAFRERRNRQLGIVLLLWLAGLLLVCWLNHNYTAPAFGLFSLILLQSLRSLSRVRWRNVPCGALLAAASILLCIGARFTNVEAMQFNDMDYGYERIKIAKTLETLPGKHLVLVRYGDEHFRSAEWVYNAADIDNSRITWARDLGERENLEVIDYFRYRHVWILDADDWPPKITAYGKSLGDALLTNSSYKLQHR